MVLHFDLLNPLSRVGSRILRNFSLHSVLSVVVAAMTGAIMAAASLQRRIFPLCVQISHPSTAQNVRLRAQFVNSSSLGWVSRRRCVMERISVASRMAAVSEARVASRSGDSVEEEEDGLALYEEELGLEEEEEEEEEEEVVSSEVNVPSNGAKVRRTFRLLGSKEKKELRAYAHQLGDKICLHQVGKWGLTANCITAISDALEANELVKIRVLDNLDEELVDTARQLEGKTGAQIVGKIGRTFLLYRPSMRKLKAAQTAEEKAYKYQKRSSMFASRSKSSRSFPGASKSSRSSPGASRGKK